MTTLETVKAWKDEEYRDTLTLAERKKLPAHPAGVVEFEAPRPDDWKQFGPMNAPHTQKIYCSMVFCTNRGCH